jgi:hypothetical protein
LEVDLGVERAGRTAAVAFTGFDGQCPRNHSVGRNVEALSKSIESKLPFSQLVRGWGLALTMKAF